MYGFSHYWLDIKMETANHILEVKSYTENVRSLSKFVCLHCFSYVDMFVFYFF